MKKQECMDAMSSLVDEWMKEENISLYSDDGPSFFSFFSWLRQNHPSYIRFKSTMGAEYDIELWFDRHFNMMWKR